MMIYLFAALYGEAQGLIRRYKLEKNEKNTRFQEFYRKEAGIRLTITGVGEIAAAAAVSSVCAEHPPGAEDVLVNLGVCAHTAGGTGAFVCNQIVELSTGRTFYPDMLYRHGFSEGTVVTGMLPWNGDFDILKMSKQTKTAALYDMEAAAVYQAGALFFAPHRMFFLKIVSDGGAAESVTPEDVGRLMEGQQERLCEWLGQLLVIARDGAQNENAALEEEALAERLCVELHCSKTMEASLRQCLRYLTLSGAAYRPVLEEMYREGRLPCRDKREGKLRLEEFKRRVLE